jgi:hypothetical protein
MSEMMKCFVMQGIGKVGVSDKTIRRALCPGDTNSASNQIED